MKYYIVLFSILICFSYSNTILLEPKLSKYLPLLLEVKCSNGGEKDMYKITKKYFSSKKVEIITEDGLMAIMMERRKKNIEEWGKKVKVSGNSQTEMIDKNAASTVFAQRAIFFVYKKEEIIDSIKVELSYIPQRKDVENKYFTVTNMDGLKSKQEMLFAAVDSGIKGKYLK